MKQLLFSLILGMAEERGMDPYRIAAIAQVESSLNQRAVGSLGEVGVFQLRPELYLNGKTEVPVTEYLNVAFKLLEEKRSKCRPLNETAWVVCWNRGIRGAKKIVDSWEETRYYKKVEEFYEEIKNSCESQNKKWNSLRCVPLSVGHS